MAAHAIPRPDAPWSANEARPLPEHCAWVRKEAMPVLIARLRSLALAKRDGGRLSARVEAFVQVLPDLFGARMELLGAAPANNVRFIMGYEIPDRHTVLMSAVAAAGDEDIGIHFGNSIVGGVATPTVEQAGAGVESAPVEGAAQ